jgi:hypothetical protein
MSGSTNVNQALIDQGYGQFREDLGGAEQQAMYGTAARAFGRFAEGMSFQGDSSALNPMRYLGGTPALNKLWQNRTPLEQYLSNEVVGTRMRRWQRPLHDMANVYARGVVKRATGQIIVPEDVQRRRDLNTLSGVMQYLRELNGRVGPSVLANNKSPRTRGRWSLPPTPAEAGSLSAIV